jgi:hypothetical protein
MRTIFLFLLSFLIFSSSFASQDLVVFEPPKKSPPRVIFADRKINMQTQFVVENKTAYLRSFFADGSSRSMRVSRKGDVRSDGMYLGWPYIVDKKGHLKAMNIAWQTMFRTKGRALSRRLMKKFPYAAATGVSLYGIAWLNIWMHSGGSAAPDTMQPETLAVIGISTFYLGDVLLTIFRRSHRQLKIGGDFFTTKIADGVDSLEFDPDAQDYIIHYKGNFDPARSRRLSDLAPEYTKSTSCVFELSLLVNK